MFSPLCPMLKAGLETTYSIYQCRSLPVFTTSQVRRSFDPSDCIYPSSFVSDCLWRILTLFLEMPIPRIALGACYSTKMETFEWESDWTSALPSRFCRLLVLSRYLVRGQISPTPRSSGWEPSCPRSRRCMILYSGVG